MGFKKFMIFLGLCLLFQGPYILKGQELRCEVDVRAQEVEQTNRQIFQTLKRQIQEFMNGQTWTNEKFGSREKIECSIIINISEKNKKQFKASGRVKSSRPIYGSDYSTTLLNIVDKEFNFEFRRNQNLNYIEGSFGSNLSSMLAFYAYLIIGFDFDSFSENGGDPYFQKAENIVSTAQSSSYDGWKSSGKDRNRNNLLSQVRGPRFQDFRLAIYQYHRKGLDIMHKDTEKGRKSIFTSLKQIEKVNESEPNSYLLDVFFSAKQEEIANIFSKAPSDQKSQVIKMLSKLDPSNLNEYKQTIKP